MRLWCAKRFFVFLLIFFYFKPIFLVDFMELEIPLDTVIDDINHIEMRQTRVTDEELILAALSLSDIKVPLWKSTKAPVGRDILYHIPYKIAAIEYGGLVFNFFFNMTNRMHVSADSLFSEITQNVQDVFILLLEPVFGNSKEISSLMPLFQRYTTIQERKAGGLVQFGFVKGPFTTQVHTSLQISERNFWLSSRERQIVENVLYQYAEGTSFDKHELYRTRYGMGDTRIKFGVNTLNRTDFQLDFGFQGIFPTSRLSDNPKLNADPNKLLDDSSSTEALQEGIVDLLKGIRDYLIDPRLGNGYWGFGCYLESKIGLFHRLLQLWICASYDKLFPREENRLFMFKRTVTPEDLERAAETHNASIVRPVLQKFIQEYLFPTSFKTGVYPGGIFNFILAVSTDIKKMRFAVGYDYYAQQRESLRKLYNTDISLVDLRVQDTQIDSVEQHKIFAESLYVKNYKRCDLSFGIGGDAAISSHGIGDDWTVYLKFVASF